MTVFLFLHLFQNNDNKDKLRKESESNMKFKKSEAELRKSQALLEQSQTEIKEKYKLMTEQKVCVIMIYRMCKKESTC